MSQLSDWKGADLQMVRDKMPLQLEPAKGGLSESDSGLEAPFANTPLYESVVRIDSASALMASDRRIWCTHKKASSSSGSSLDEL